MRTPDKQAWSWTADKCAWNRSRSSDIKHQIKKDYDYKLTSVESKEDTRQTRAESDEDNTQKDARPAENHMDAAVVKPWT